MADREKSLFRKTKCVGTWMMALLALFPAALSATESVTASAGGTGGNPYTIDCGRTQAMVGVQGDIATSSTAAYVVGSIQAMCVGLNADGSWNGTPAPAPRIAGVYRATAPVSILCSQNHAVSAISGRSGLYVDSLRIQCAPLVEPGHLSGVGSVHSGEIGGRAGNAFGPFFCPSDKPGKGFTGKAGDWIDSVALVCDYPPVADPVVKSLTLNPNSPVDVKGIPLNSRSVVGGTAVNGSVTLNANAPSSGTLVNLSMSVPNVAAFQSNPITVPSGTKTAPFVVDTNPVSSNKTTSISATPNTGSLSAAALTVQEPSLQSLSLSTTKTSPGGSVTGTVTLSGKAFSGGVAVILTSSDTAAATVPATVTIPQNQTAGTFPVTVGSANQNGCSVVSAAYNQVRQDGILAVRIPGNAAFGLAVTSTSGSQATATVSFPAPSDSSRTLSLVSSKPATASVPPSVTVVPFPPGTTTANFTISTSGASPPLDCAAITASDGKGNQNSLFLSMGGRSVSAVN